MSNSRKHIEPDITSANILSAYGVILHKANLTTDGELDESAMRPIGLISGVNWGDSRPITLQGEIGSRTLFTLINEGQKTMSFQRLLPFPNSVEVINTPVRTGSILLALYQEELLAETGGQIPGILLMDIEQYAAFRLPIQIVLTMNDEMGNPVAKVWLKNASVAGTSMNFAAGSQFSGEPTQISWEETIEQPIE